jgi:hypothetical protein
MKIKKMKFVSMLVISSIVAPGFSAIASTMTSDGQTPETRLMESTLVAQGSGSSSSEIAQAAARAVQQYVQESASESDADRTANLEQAWVDFKLMTPSQAHEKAVEISQNASLSKSVSDVIDSTAAILENSKGAQFSACAVAGTSAVVIGVGGVVIEIIGSVKSGDTTAKGTTQFPDGVPTSKAAAPIMAAGVAAMGVGFAIAMIALNSASICND